MILFISYNFFLATVLAINGNHEVIRSKQILHNTSLCHRFKGQFYSALTIASLILHYQSIPAQK
jgi:hypothetical protein